MASSRAVIVASAGLLAVAGVIFALRDDPLPVDVVAVRRGTLDVTIDEEGETRVRERFVIASPVAGRLERLALDEGEIVESGQVLARVYPIELDPRAKAEAKARLEAAEATERETSARVEQARATLEHAQRNLARAERLTEAGVASTERRELATLDRVMRQKDLEAAILAARAAEFNAAAARAVLFSGRNPTDESAVSGCDPGAQPCIELRSPVDGRVLRVWEESERVVPVGTPILEVGDPASLEIVVDVLSSDAVHVVPGALVLLGGWGGEETLHGRVRLIEPSAFTKLSALGVEEQRVNVVIDFAAPPNPIGDGYRLDARIVIWQGTDVLKIPSSSLFRRGSSWNAFIVEGGRASRREVQVGHRNSREAELLDGAREGENVILYPSDRVEDGTRIRPIPRERGTE